MNITRLWLEEQLDEDALERGEVCFLHEQVRKVEMLAHGHTIKGEIEEDEYRYSVYIEIDAHGIDGDCSCPAGYNCEHVAALLFTMLDDQIALPGTAGAMVSAADTSDGRLNQARAGLLQQEQHDYPADVHQRVLYILRPEPFGFHIRLHVVAARLLKQGGYGTISPFQLKNFSNRILHRFIMPTDTHILQQIDGCLAGPDSFVPTGLPGAALVRLLLQTARCHWLDVNTPPLTLGAARIGTWFWHENEDVCQHLLIRLDGSANDLSPHALVIPCSPPFYVDDRMGVCGSIASECPDDLCEALLFRPPIAPDDPLPLADLSFAWPAGVERPKRLHIRHQQHAATPVLQLVSEPDGLDGMRLLFDYGGRLLPQAHDKKAIYYHQNGHWLNTPIDAGAEQSCIQHLLAAGLIPNPDKHATAWLLPEGTDWPVFLTAILPRLQQTGFRVEHAPGFRYEIVQVRSWNLDCKEHGIMGEIHFEVVLEDGRHLDLIEVIANWVKAEPERLSNVSLDELRISRVQHLPLPDDRILPIAGEMLYSILTAMLDIFSAGGDGKRDIAGTEWLQLHDKLADLPYVHVRDDTIWLERIRQLTNIRTIPAVAPPEGLAVSLRDYQQCGLNWLQHLRRLDVGALLADDMGLGKTIQTLAHILKEKETGKLQHPALLIAPTSLMHNWTAEVARFAPGIKVLLLHGVDRRHAFPSIKQYDLVLTTYGLLHRDGGALKAHRWSLLILDEAQYIRNPRTGAARTARELDADQRICLTGTPMENHLGELWSLFDFLMPGYLYDIRTFSRCFRKPIERDGDSERQSRLNLRIRPFMLRRSKEDVAAELPAKSEIIRIIDMGEGQRALYEGVRLIMHQKVRDAMQRMGKGKSHIIMLDALLKMRQVCCDPHLLKRTLQQSLVQDTPQPVTLESIRKAGSAKLDLLRIMLPEMIVEGRRILLFSQFTGMLKLIASLCDELSIPYLMLTGTTRDRAIPVNAFQNHEAPLFLISLKAGGVGLNLTAADTIIHYDPWWNPAAEAQASDRAHRIGQDKPVFVYKLITGGSVESRILDMQLRKQQLADALYQGSKQGAPVWSNEELESLFAPREEIDER